MMKIQKGLSHLDAEVVNWFSSAYACTSESQFAAKKSHKKGKPSTKPTVFNILRDQNINFDQILAILLLVTFVRR